MQSRVIVLTCLNAVLTTPVHYEFTGYSLLPGRNVELTPPVLLLPKTPHRSLRVPGLVTLPEKGIGKEDRKAMHLVRHQNVLRQLQTRAQKYVEKHFHRSLSKEERTAMLRKHPKPDTAVVVPPRLDSFISDFAGKKLDKGRDAQLAKIQGTMLYATNPLTNLWAELIDQGLTQDSQAAMFVSDVLEIIQRTLVLLGNASNLISETRREVALESVHPSLKKYGKGDFSKAGEDLFGQEFKDNLVKKVEADSAISKAVNIVSRSASNPNSSGRVYRKQASDNRFLGGRTSRYGAVSGTVYQPYKYQGKGKHTPGSPSTGTAVCSTDLDRASRTMQ